MMVRLKIGRGKVDIVTSSPSHTRIHKSLCETIVDRLSKSTHSLLFLTIEGNKSCVCDDLVSSLYCSRHLNLLISSSSEQSDLSFSLVSCIRTTNEKLTGANKDMLCIQIQLRNVIFVIHEG